MKPLFVFIFLFILQIITLLLGGYGYYLFERKKEVNCKPITIETTEFNDSMNNDSTTSEFSGDAECEQLTYSDSVFFMLTLVSTIGYGNEVPQTQSGKIYTILISYIGIPLNFITIAKLGDIFKQFIAHILKPIEKRLNNNKKYFVLLQAIIALISGKLIFLFLPAFLFMKLEGWSYLDSFYFCYVTIYSIGFGDLVATTNVTVKGVWLRFYIIFVYIWVYLGLAYITLLINLAFEYFNVKVKNFEREIAEIFVDKIVSNNQYYMFNNDRAKGLHKIIAEERNKKVFLGRYIPKLEGLDNYYYENDLKSTKDLNQNSTNNNNNNNNNNNKDNLKKVDDEQIVELDNEIKTSEFQIRIDYDTEQILVETSKRLSERLPTLEKKTINNLINSLNASIRSKRSYKKTELEV